MRRGLDDGYELDDDPSRIDVDYVFNYLSVESYWAQRRPRDVVARSISGSARVIGLYYAGAQVGFARAVSDDAVLAHLMDVFIDPGHRGRGLGVELVREAVDGGPQRDLSWRLDTSDADGLYARFGFTERESVPIAMVRRSRR
jgi:GNAT superfamily N-acetyltransferase